MKPTMRACRPWAGAKGCSAIPSFACRVGYARAKESFPTRAYGFATGRVRAPWALNAAVHGQVHEAAQTVVHPRITRLIPTAVIHHED